MAEVTAQTLIELDTTRQRLNAEIEELQSRIPTYVQLARRGAIAVALAVSVFILLRGLKTMRTTRQSGT